MQDIQSTVYSLHQEQPTAGILHGNRGFLRLLSTHAYKEKSSTISEVCSSGAKCHAAPEILHYPKEFLLYPESSQKYWRKL